MKQPKQMVCNHCGSTNIRRDCARWDTKTQAWTLPVISDNAHCLTCKQDDKPRVIDLPEPARGMPAIKGKPGQWF